MTFRNWLPHLRRTLSVMSFLACSAHFVQLFWGSAYIGSESAVNDLCWAATRGNTTKIEHLRRQGVSLDKPCWGGEQTPLTVAVVRGDPPMTEYLLAWGADPNRGGNSKTTPLRLAEWHLAEIRNRRYYNAEAIEKELRYIRIVRELKDAGGVSHKVETASDK